MVESPLFHCYFVVRKCCTLLRGILHYCCPFHTASSVLSCVFVGFIHLGTAGIKSNGLKMNVAKTQALILSRKCGRPQAEQIQINLHGETINTQDSVKYLGVVVDQNLTWEQQVSKVRQKSLAGLAFIRRGSAYLPSSTRCLLYNTLVLPHLNYCSVVWHSCGKTIGDQLECVPNYAMRIVLKKPPRTSNKTLQNKLGWTTLRRLPCSAKFIVVSAPPYLCSKFITNSEIGYRGTRGANKLHFDRTQTSTETPSSFKERNAITIFHETNFKPYYL